MTNIMSHAGMHPVITGKEALNAFGTFLNDNKDKYSRIFVLCDENTIGKCFPVIQHFFAEAVHKIVIPAGERNKNIHSCVRVWEHMHQSGGDRNSLLINLGGGMITDLGGFAAATYLRGIKYLNIPTSLLGMVDASTGGKTGIDLGSYKNTIGTFTFPEIVFIDPLFLDTLPYRYLKDGIAEMLKHGLISSANLWTTLASEIKSNSATEISSLLKEKIILLLDESIRIKATVTSIDPFEKGIRKILNFGHTIGHAIETYSLRHNTDPLSHGEAVAAGMICETFLSGKLSGLSAMEQEEITSAISSFYPWCKMPEDSFHDILQLTRFDKKAENGKNHFTLLNKIGEAVTDRDCSSGLILESLSFYNNVYSLSPHS
jgi:3-dehydroquinate synthase